MHVVLAVLLILNLHPKCGKQMCTFVPAKHATPCHKHVVKKLAKLNTPKRCGSFFGMFFACRAAHSKE